jgi:hypothetical protein
MFDLALDSFLAFCELADDEIDGQRGDRGYDRRDRDDVPGGHAAIIAVAPAPISGPRACALPDRASQSGA